jgi:hypothetical protein
MDTNESFLYTYFKNLRSASLTCSPRKAGLSLYPYPVLGDTSFSKPILKKQQLEVLRKVGFGIAYQD